MEKGSSSFSRWQYRHLRTQAEKLRKRGLSYKEIRKETSVSKSTISKWCRDIILTKIQIERLGSLYDTQLRGAKANQRKSEQRRQETRKQALAEISTPTPESLKIAGAMLYWAEGNKQHGTAVTNSDPAFIVFYVRWLQKILDIQPNCLKAHIHLHQGQLERKEKLFWSNLTGIPMNNFGKSFYKPVGTGHRKNILYHGTIRISVRGAGVELLRHRILGWAEAIARHLVPEDVITIHYRGRTGR